MPLYSEKMEASIKKNIQIAFKIAPGVVFGKIYKPIISENSYRDVSLVYDSNNFVEIRMYVSIEPPAKVVKTLGWWKEDDQLPILCYMPTLEIPNSVDGFCPEKNDLIIVDDAEGYISGKYVITNTKMYGINRPLCWLCSIVPKRQKIAPKKVDSDYMKDIYESD